MARALAGLVALVAAQGCVRYVPQPVEPAAHAAEYRARRLSEPQLVAWVSRWSERPAAGRWTDRQLALAALGLRAELARARAEWRAALAAERSAGARPAPGAAAGVERAVSGSEGASPWVVSLGALLSVELGGKRGARLQRARARTALAEAELRRTAWRIASETRAAALALAEAEAERAESEREARALAEVESLERARYQEAALTAAELARTASEVQEAKFRVSVAEGAAIDARAALAGLTALPLASLDSLEIEPEAGSGCVAIVALGDDSLAALALTRRPEIGRALAEYAVAEADLRAAVARQYPDLDIGPGFIWDQGVHRWTLALALPNLLGFRNRAAVDEALAGRAAAAARVAEAQDELLGDVARATGRCRGAQIEAAAADSQVAVAHRTAALAQAAYDRGETARLDPVLAELGVVRAERSRRLQAARLVAAGRGLEAALGGSAAAESDRWPDPRSDVLMEEVPK
ncbi:MAG TPA: TolC family protein [Gemmatimonadales bacterium]|nr:TolC family protein [Gemmatimonadales bacterium]